MMNRATSRILVLVALGLVAVLAGCEPSQDTRALVSVPVVSGHGQSDAVRALRKAGFRVVVETTPYPANSAAHVVEQDPSAGQPEPPGTTVRILVAVPEGSQVRLPDYVGMRSDLAVADLTRKGLGSTIVALPLSAGASGLVLAQNPAVGALVPAGSKVTLQVPRLK